jgi:8-oxo-dGTP pyrophosphatase MutT (NUDIX family)
MALAAASPERALSRPVLELAETNPWRTVEVGAAYRNERLTLRQDRVVQPDGVEGEYVFLSLAGPVVGIVPVTDDGSVILVRQWRYPWNRASWEIPAGHCEPDETVEASAERELAEEVQVRASSWTSLGALRASATIDAEFHLFLARGLEPAEHRPRDGAEQDMVVRAVPLETALEAAASGEIVHAVTVAALFRAARRLHQR